MCGGGGGGGNDRAQQRRHEEQMALQREQMAEQKRQFELQLQQQHQVLILCMRQTRQQVRVCKLNKHWPLRLAHSARAWAAVASAPALQVAQVACPSPDN